MSACIIASRVLCGCFCTYELNETTKHSSDIACIFWHCGGLGQPKEAIQPNYSAETAQLFDNDLGSSNTACIHRSGLLRRRRVPHRGSEAAHSMFAWIPAEFRSLQDEDWITAQGLEESCRVCVRGCAIPS